MWARVAAFFNKLPWIVRTAGGGLISYSTPKLAIAAGVPLDKWLVSAGQFIGLHFDKEVAFWALVAIVGLLLFTVDRWRKAIHVHHLPVTSEIAPVASVETVVVRNPFPIADRPTMIDAIIEDKHQSNLVAIEHSSKRAEMPIWKAVAHVRDVIGDTDEQGCYTTTVQQIRQAAYDGRIEIWGRRAVEEAPSARSVGTPSDLYTKIDKSYWADHKLTPLVTHEHYADHDHTSAESYAYSRKYWSLRVHEWEIEREWPNPAPLSSPRASGALSPPAAEQASDIPITLNSLGAYIRGFPRIRSLTKKIAANLDREIDNGDGRASVAQVELALALGFKTIADLDLALTRGADLIIRIAPYFIPKTIHPDYSLHCLFEVVGGRMGPERYWEILKGLKHTSSSFGHCKELGEIYALIAK